MPHALVVDVERDAAERAAAMVATEGFTVATAASREQARRQLVLQAPDLVLLDLGLPDGNGLQLFDDVKSLSNADIVLVSGRDHGAETSWQALRARATDCLVKPLDAKQMRSALARMHRSAPQPDNAAAVELQSMLEREGHFGQLWGRSAAMRRVYEQVLRVAGTAVTVFVTGESGSGKEIVARIVHELSRRSARPFLAVNCGAISPNLIESEIFGHEKGSFTGAERQHLGFFERASGGTLFLDEITEMPPDLQVKLLRVLETGTFMRVGSTQTIETDVRLIAATNRDPQQAVEAGKLREDLLYRLNVFPIHMPPLRERRDDIVLLATHFLDEISRREGLVKRFSRDAVGHLASYRWPGNVRELRNIVQRAYVMAGESTVVVDACLPDDAQPFEARAADAATPVLQVEVGTPLAEVERRLMLATLEHYGGRKEPAAAALGVSLKTLYNRLKGYVPAALPLMNGEGEPPEAPAPAPAPRRGGDGTRRRESAASADTS
jgi:two-component system response regulator AtoC